LFHQVKMAGYQLLVSLIILPSTLLSQDSESDYILQAKQALFRLDSANAAKLLEREIKQHPENGYAYYYQNCQDFIYNLLDGSDYIRYREETAERVNALKSLDDNNPEYLYFLSAVYLQSSLLDFLNKETWQGSKNFYLAHRYIKENNAIYPGYPDNQKILGIMELILSLIPSDKDWLFNVLGMKGDREAGTMQLLEYMNNCEQHDQLEAVLIFGMASNHFASDPALAFRELSKNNYDDSESPLYQYVYAFAARKAGNQDDALDILARLDSGNDYSRNPFADLLSAEIKLSRLDKEAGMYYEKFIREYRGGNFRKMAYHKLSWHYFLQGDDSLYEAARDRAQKVGWQYLEQDKQAMSEAMDTFDLNYKLLRARVVYDGGQNHEALAGLLEVSDNDMVTLKDQVEYPYRLARLYHSLEDTARAKKNYLIAMERGAAFPFYFAPYSALQLAGIYESEGAFSEAEKYYSTCLDLNRHQYTGSIGSEARAGIKRVRDYSNE